MLLSAICFTHGSVICWSWLTTDITSRKCSLEGAVHKLSGETGNNSSHHSVIFHHSCHHFSSPIMIATPFYELSGFNGEKLHLIQWNVICSETRAGIILRFGEKGCSTSIIAFNSQMQFFSCCLDTTGDSNMWRLIHNFIIFVCSPVNVLPQTIFTQPAFVLGLCQAAVLQVSCTGREFGQTVINFTLANWPESKNDDG